MSRNPVEPSKEVLSPSEEAQAVRLAAIAELDAINLYVQLADRVKDERVKKVLLDVAREEKTHLGEFMELLRGLDTEQAEELQKGAAEVGGLLAREAQAGSAKAIKDPESTPLGPLSTDEASALAKAVEASALTIRSFRRLLPVLRLGAGQLAAPSDIASEGEVLRPLGGTAQLSTVTEQFIISREELEFYRRQGLPPVTSAAVRAAERLAVAEETAIAEALSGATKIKISGDWSSPGSVTRMVSQALGQMLQEVPLPVAFLSPAARALLASVIDPSGVSELDRLLRLVKEVAVTSGLKGVSLLLISPSPSVADIVVGTDTSVEYLYSDRDGHRFELRESIAVRIKDPRGIALITSP